MKGKDAAKLTKYFPEGVCAEIWSYTGDGRWSIRVHRGRERVSFLGLDTLRRMILVLKYEMESGLSQYCLYQDIDRELTFYTPESAWFCIEAIGQAVEYVQTMTKDKDWHDVPADLFTRKPEMVTEKDS